MDRAGRRNSRWTCPLPDTEAINASTTLGVVEHSPRLIDGSPGGSQRSLIIHPSSVAAVMAAAARQRREKHSYLRIDP